MGKISDELLKAINILIDKKISSLSFDRTVDGKVLDKTSTGYLVSVEGNQINVHNFGDGEFKKNDTVKVCIPQNNIKNAYLLVPNTNPSIDINFDYYEQFASMFKNKWRFEVFSTSSNTIEALKVKVPSRSVFIDDSMVSKTMNIGDSYTGKATTNIYVDSNCIINTTLVTDDAGAIFVNGQSSGVTVSGANTTIQLNLHSGWNEIIVIYTEGSGADGFAFIPPLSKDGRIRELNFCPHKM